MSKAVWNIVVIGALATLLMVIGMLMSLSSFQGTPAWMQTKLAESVKNQFGYLATGTEVRNDGARLILRVVYEAKAGKVAFSDELAKAEMQQTAEYAIKTYEGRDRTDIDLIQIRRTETHGRGCFQSVYKAGHEIPSPVKKVQDPTKFQGGSPFAPRPLNR